MLKDRMNELADPLITYSQTLRTESSALREAIQNAETRLTDATARAKALVVTVEELYNRIDRQQSHFGESFSAPVATSPAGRAPSTR